MIDYPKTYDTALPQEWYDEATRLAGVNPAGHVVWSYDEPNYLFGTPYAVDAIGDLIILLADLGSRTSDDISDDTRARMQARIGSALNKVKEMTAE